MHGGEGCGVAFPIHTNRESGFMLQLRPSRPRLRVFHIRRASSIALLDEVVEGVCIANLGRETHSVANHVQGACLGPQPTDFLQQLKPPDRFLTASSRS